jgi:hypothetical protein
MKELVWSHSLEKHHEIKHNLLNSFDNMEKQTDRNKFESITYTDYFNKTPHEHRPYTFIFINALDDFFKNFKKYYCTNEFLIINCWFQQYYKNDNHEWHIHSETNLSLVYYIELDNKDKSTEFYDSVKKEKFQLDVKEGDIVVFPSFIPHRSPKIVTDNRKTIISCNINLIDLDMNLINIGVQ